ncbi:MAG: dockerin type I domain-containing protein, partial [Aureliella sp.]
MRLRKSLRAIETLESRRLLASDWQNAANPLDVDASGFVAPLDVLLVVNDINQKGVRGLPATKPAGFSGPLCDTSGDGVLSALDALRVVNAINQFPDAPTLDVNLSQASDGNGDQVVLTSDVVYEGASVPNISIKVERLEGEA